ncbi:hypothetical protein CBR59_10570 [Bacillus thuringiensis]|nr:hypothetical protein GBN91_19790 [Bacillus sp. B1-WWTP-T-0.5-Post-4]MDR4152112.1 hypothetical protein [Bacillus cereus]PNK28629.1 hypothetical protein CBP87_16200 [Bacillus thuringiensis]QEL68597.1 hypothetical protein DN399_11120 [Bacillus sp. AR4-2]QEL73875.1 hypothetical protein DN405_11125 [Bacillus sp. SH8-8]
MLKVIFYLSLSRYLLGSKTPASKFSGSKEVRRGLIKVSLYYKQSKLFSALAKLNTAEKQIIQKTDTM